MLEALTPMGIALATGWAVVTAGTGALVTELGPWYRGLRKPPWQPPDWLFGPAWTVIFLLAALAGAVAWSRGPATGEWRAMLVGAYLLNGVLNVLWSVLFFRQHRPDRSVLEIVPLWLSIVAMALVVRPVAWQAALLLLPYIAWVTFAGVLNLEIVRLNQPFRGR
jgi:tryptophan-rich sensory protein